MLYIHDTTCISPQQTLGDIDIKHLKSADGNKMMALEPSYQNIPTPVLRRMGKAVRMSVGAAMPLLQHFKPDGLIIGTANGGMEDCIKFLNQIIVYEEGMLTPGNFVQSTPNAIASQISLLSANTAYNITHVHRGLAFENAILDAIMLLKEYPDRGFLVGGVDEISSYNYNIDNLEGWYKKETVNNTSLYLTGSPGTIAGEGAAMFLVKATSAGAIARLRGIAMLHTTDENQVLAGLEAFSNKYLLPGERIDLLLSGENGDSRHLKFYEICEGFLGSKTAVGRFKHMSGEYPTASAFAVWLACTIIQKKSAPAQILKSPPTASAITNILIYNNFKGNQHSFILLSC
ncbi:MAG: beta-ketoacyl synthase chain length factor [Chitinophagaceae bacterium]|nr:beta-ketoacyl synthase chain length factor [Chitinophagaceae bacterium]